MLFKRRKKMNLHQSDKYTTQIELTEDEFETLYAAMDYFQTGIVTNEAKLTVGNLESISIRKFHRSDETFPFFTITFETPETE